MSALVLDMSALVAVLQNEPEAPVLHAILKATDPYMSTGTYAEIVMLWQARYGTRALRQIDEALALYGVGYMPVSAGDIAHLRTAIERFGKGRGAEPACLNLGDVFAYALAKRMDIPLLAKGHDFAKTDARLYPYQGP